MKRHRLLVLQKSDFKKVKSFGEMQVKQEKAMAAFSAFVRITSETQRDYNFFIDVENIGGDEYKFIISHEYLCNEQKGIWLIVSEKPVPPENQNFRNYIWSSENKEKLLLNKIQLECKESSSISHFPYIEVVIEKEKISQTYIYIDYPSFIFDGGYYYCIDLSTYQL